jgi:hypothetical protein
MEEVNSVQTPSHPSWHAFKVDVTRRRPEGRAPSPNQPVSVSVSFMV